VGAVTCARSTQKLAMLQLQVSGRRGTWSFRLSRLQPCQGGDAKEKVSESSQDYSGKGVLFQEHYGQDYTLQQCYAATHSNSSSLICPWLHRPALQEWKKWVR
jgi:hypothetical protein